MKNLRNYVSNINEIVKLENEVIKETKICEGLYVSNKGRVWGTDLKGIFEIKPYINTYSSKKTNGKKYNTTKYGYYKFHFNKKMYRVHALVAHEFVPGYVSGLCIDHINNNSLDNRAENLQWITRSENTKKFWDSMDEETLAAFKEKYSEGLKEAHKEGRYKKHLNILHNKKED